MATTRLVYGQEWMQFQIREAILKEQRHEEETTLVGMATTAQPICQRRFLPTIHPFTLSTLPTVNLGGERSMKYKMFSISREKNSSHSI